MPRANMDDLIRQGLRLLAERGVRATLHPDLTATLRAPAVGPDERLYRLEARARITAPSAGTLPVHPLHPTLVVAPYVSDAADEMLRLRGIDYVDLAGNALVRWRGLLVDVRGRRPAARTTPLAPANRHRPFTRSGCQVTFALLTWPLLAAAPVRTLARAAGAAVGTAQAVVTDLTAAGHLVDGRLERADDLLARWTEAYALTLAASLHRGLYRAPAGTPLEELLTALTSEDLALSGESAADRLDAPPDEALPDDAPPGDALPGGDLLNPAALAAARPLTFYTAGDPIELAARHGLLPAERYADADVVLRFRFWTPPTAPTGSARAVPLAPIVLVHADLRTAADARLVERAALLRARHLTTG